jgi:hypothetical protein
MGWEPEHNRNSLSPHGLKEAQGHAARALHDANCVSGPEMPPGILSMQPLGPGRSSPYAPTSAARPKDTPREIAKPYDSGPHDDLHSDPRHLTPRHRG